jgi:hypothetical protein
MFIPKFDCLTDSSGSAKTVPGHSIANDDTVLVLT